MSEGPYDQDEDEGEPMSSSYAFEPGEVAAMRAWEAMHTDAGGGRAVTWRGPLAAFVLLVSVAVVSVVGRAAGWWVA